MPHIAFTDAVTDPLLHAIKRGLVEHLGLDGARLLQIDGSQRPRTSRTPIKRETAPGQESFAAASACAKVKPSVGGVLSWAGGGAWGKVTWFGRLLCPLSPLPAPLAGGFFFCAMALHHPRSRGTGSVKPGLSLPALLPRSGLALLQRLQRMFAPVFSALVASVDARPAIHSLISLSPASTRGRKPSSPSPSGICLRERAVTNALVDFTLAKRDARPNFGEREE